MAAPTTAPTAEFQDGGKPVAGPVYLVDLFGNPIGGTPANWTQSGQSFNGSTGKLATLTNANVVMAASLFNPANSGKSLLVYSIQVVPQASTANVTTNLTTTDPAYSNVITPQNLKIGAGATSVASVTSSPNNNTVSSTTGGTLFGNGGGNANVTNELLTNGAVILLPVGSANGLEVFNTIGTAGNSISFTFRWIEY